MLEERVYDLYINELVLDYNDVFKMVLDIFTVIKAL